MGPRPLPLHLAAHAWTVLSSHAALPLLKKGSLPWNPQVAAAAADFARALDGVNPDAFGAAVTRETFRRLEQYLDGLGAYRHHPYQRLLRDPPVIWDEGTTRLLDYGGDPHGLPLLVVPSLVNRAYVLDLTEERSFLRYMAARGFRTFLVDWQAPGEEERDFTMTDYVMGRLARALDVVLALTGRAPVVAGYCMGGMLALGLTTRRPDDTAGLVLLATPWDFHTDRDDHLGRLETMEPWFEALMRFAGELPVDVLQTLFAALDPTLADRKFRSFAALDPRSPKAREFVALEDWVNDGIPLAGPVARECLFEWYGRNTPANRQWPIGGAPVLPESHRAPALAVVPSRDRIVPPASAMALAEAIPGARPHVVAAGHIGMVTGSGAVTLVYGPVAEWLDQLGRT
ncbi:MAG: alpha/beta fold hydrolase [Alphaproteobacteria bacterium]